MWANKVCVEFWKKDTKHVAVHLHVHVQDFLHVHLHDGYFCNQTGVATLYVKTSGTESHSCLRFSILHQSYIVLYTLYVICTQHKMLKVKLLLAGTHPQVDNSVRGYTAKAQAICKHYIHIQAFP